MPAQQFPTVASVEVIATQPKPSDVKIIRHLRSLSDAAPADVALVVKITFEKMPPVTSTGFDLYLDDFRIAKYRAFKNGIYFKIHDPRFLAEHAGKQIRFALAGEQFFDTGYRLPDMGSGPAALSAMATDGARAPARLPTQKDVLGG